MRTILNLRSYGNQIDLHKSEQLAKNSRIVEISPFQNTQDSTQQPLIVAAEKN